jgi:hypothetical protein
MGSPHSMTLKQDAKSGAFKDRIRLPEDEHPTVEDIAEALKRFPRYEVK